jgi:hypothetical protein
LGIANIANEEGCFGMGFAIIAIANLLNSKGY